MKKLPAQGLYARLGAWARLPQVHQFMLHQHNVIIRSDENIHSGQTYFAIKQTVLPGTN
jgi:hypothetical protein